MFISDKLIYLDLQKTGCTHVRKLLGKIPSLNGSLYRKHNSLDDLDARIIVGKRQASALIAGNIRNPWDWYVSLWAFGCMEKGGFYKKAIQKNYWYKGPKKSTQIKSIWRRVYADANDPKLFQE